MTPYPIIAALLAGLCIGWQVQSWRWGAADSARLQAELEHSTLARQRADTAAATHEAAKERDRAAFDAIITDVGRLAAMPGARDMCLDADSLLILSRAVDGSAPAGEPAPAVPAADGAH